MIHFLIELLLFNFHAKELVMSLIIAILFAYKNHFQSRHFFDITLKQIVFVRFNIVKMFKYNIRF